MVELTYQMVLSTLQTIALVVGIVYYLTIMRNQQRTRELTLKAQEHATETRQLDLYTKWQLELTRPDFLKNWFEISQLEWEDFDDFAKKYSHNVNAEHGSKRFSLWYYFDGLGYLLYRGMIDADTVFDMIGSGSISHWNRYEPIIRGFRERDGRPGEAWRWFEYLANEMKKVREQRGLPEYVPAWRPE